MKKLFLFLLIVSSLYGFTKPSELFKKINESKDSLQKTNKQKIITNKQLQKIAKQIEKIEKEIAVYDEKLSKLNQFLTKEQQRYQKSMAEIKGIDDMVKGLNKDIEEKRKEFAKKVSEQLGSIVAKNKISGKDEKSVVMQEVLSRYKSYNQKELLKLSRNIDQKKSLRDNLLKRKEEISKNIKDIKKQRKQYQIEKAKKEKLVKKLALKKRIYSKKLKDIFKRQTVIRLTLAKLKLLKEEEVSKAKEREKELRKRIRESKKYKLTDTNYKTKQYGSSIVYEKIYKYRGPKTISPLKNPKLVRRFGTFIDPIYKMKTKSDYVILTSHANDKRVFNVLNGEVAYKGRNPMLGKMVVVKHSNGLHTIYADLDKISPFVKVGYKLKKGAVVGKIKRKLIFETLKDGKLFNPVSLIDI